jgi:subtilase family serine protease
MRETERRPGIGPKRGKWLSDWPMRLLTFGLPCNPAGKFLDHSGDKPYKLRQSLQRVLPGDYMFSCKCLRLSLLTSALVSILTLSSLSFAAADRIVTIDSTQIVELKGNVTPMAKPQFDQGPVEPSRHLRISMLCLPTAEQQGALNKLLAEQQDVKSPNYRKWLTPVEYGERFGLSQGDLKKITAWLTSQGFKITYVANGRDFVSFSGNAAQVDSVFRTAIHNFNVNGKMHFANTQAPMIPAALSGIVGGFRGLHDFFPHAMNKPAYTVTGATTHFLAPGDLATIYNINPLYQLTPKIDGTGETIVIAGQSDVYLDDLHYYRTAFGISDISGCPLDTTTHTIIQAGSCTSGNFQMVVPGDGSDPGVVSGDVSESDLDIQTVSAVARGAKIIFVTSGGGVDDSASWAIDNDLSKVISYSYGLCEAYVTAPSIAASEVIYKNAAQSEGISIFAASGDAGAAICDGDNGTYPAELGISVSYPSSSQYVTGVGGTEFDEGTGSYWSANNNIPGDGGSATTYIPETAWNDSLLVNNLDATGGGPSNCAFGSGTTAENGYAFEVCSASPNGGFPKPSWQVGITPSDGVRDVPDIAFSASNVNDVYIVCIPQSEIPGETSPTSTCVNGITSALTTFPRPSAFGGTSASTPLAAAMTVMLNQFLSTNGLGSINQQLYTLYKNNPPPTGPFHDVVGGTNTTTGGTSNNIEDCVPGTPSIPSFPAALQCPNSGTFGYSAGTGYDLVTGLGSLNVDSFFTAWLATEVSFTVNATALTPSSIAAGSSATATSTVTITPASNSASQSATYTMGCSGLPTGAQCAFNPSNVSSADSFTSTMTISGIPVTATTGTDTITVAGTAQSASVVESTTVSLSVTATTESFTLTTPASGQTVTVAQGQITSGIVITVGSTSSPSFISSSGGQPVTNAPVNYACSGLPSESQCLFSPSSSTNATSVSLTIQTTAPSAALRMPDKPFDRGSRVLYAALLPGLLGLVLTFGSRKRSMAGMRVLGLLMVLGCSTMWLGSCSGSNNSSTSNPGTPTGSSTVTVTATAGGSVPQQTFSFTLSVTPAAAR